MASRYRPKSQHLNYWLSHTTPVLLVLVNENTNTCYWQHVTAEKLRIENGVNLIDVPSTQTLGPGSRSALQDIAEGTQQIDVVRRLFRVWLAQSSLFTYSWNNDIQMPRDFHGMDLFMPSLPGRGVTAGDVILGRPQFGPHETAQLQEMLGLMPYNKRNASCTHALIGLVSANRQALRPAALPAPPTGSEFGITTEYVPLLLRDKGPVTELIEVDAEGNALDDDTFGFLLLNRQSASDVAANEAKRRANRLWGSL